MGWSLGERRTGVGGGLDTFTTQYPDCLEGVRAEQVHVCVQSRCRICNGLGQMLGEMGV